MKRKKLYAALFFSCIAGYIWLYLNIHFALFINNSIGGVCLIKHITGIPCPSCGSTRSVISLFYGNFIEALYWNPIGLILVSILVFVPPWIIFDLILKKDTFHSFYIKAEQFLKNKKVAIVSVILVVINWIWTIKKDL